MPKHLDFAAFCCFEIFERQVQNVLAVWRSGVQVPYAPFEKVLIFKAFFSFWHKLSRPKQDGFCCLTTD